jgi:hypothetical protein
VNLAPVDLRKEGPAFDLPIAVGVLIASDQLFPIDSEESAMIQTVHLAKAIPIARRSSTGRGGSSDQVRRLLQSCVDCAKMIWKAVSLEVQDGKDHRP